MKTSPPLLPILRSHVQGELLALLYLNPAEEFTLGALAQELGVTPTSVMREADRLIEAGLLSGERVGRSRLIRARTDTPLYPPLAELIALTYGPLPYLSRALSGVARIEEAYIYGSWSARYRGERGDPPADVDVLVVGEPDPDVLFDVGEEATRKLHRPVNIRRISPDQWHSGSSDPFLVSVRERPLVAIELTRER
ncbi:MarR family transcriptional regulator [Streptomyces sp. LHD-70]|uniref:MarR family transcriptional regulator n=1 Tax=Streptomyces sp. LHD-70 TaxID=3072140 RepID=UPI00280C7237|nr:MarR family transcriptional regulator [Streptomyces sp. LHD-70]MDQ8707267.1 MarR family transcriptional regulator [Streptomyces sp. LHD-70]